MSFVLKTQLLAILAMFNAFREEFSPELRTRLADSTWQKFTALCSEFESITPHVQAMTDDGSAPPTPAPVLQVVEVSALKDVLLKSLDAVDIENIRRIADAIVSTPAPAPDAAAAAPATAPAPAPAPDAQQ